VKNKIKSPRLHPQLSNREKKEASNKAEWNHIEEMCGSWGRFIIRVEMERIFSASDGFMESRGFQMKNHPNFHVSNFPTTLFTILVRKSIQNTLNHPLKPTTMDFPIKSL
jgi:hypothetical protein